MKKLIILNLALVLCACSTSWVRELEKKNPLKDSTQFKSVYFRFDTIINDFEVSGILYPQHNNSRGWNGYQNGVRLFFHSLKTGKEYEWTDWMEYDHDFQNIFMSKNVYDICSAEGFNEFEESYIFKYDTTSNKNQGNKLYPNAEYQFYDVDFDGVPELLINFYQAGPYSCTSYQIYEITDSALVRKEPVNEPYINSFLLDDQTWLDTKNKTITNNYYRGSYMWNKFFYRVDNNGDIYAEYYVYNIRNGKNIIKSDTTFIR